MVWWERGVPLNAKTELRLIAAVPAAIARAVGRRGMLRGGVAALALGEWQPIKRRLIDALALSAFAPVPPLPAAHLSSWSRPHRHPSPPPLFFFFPKPPLKKKISDSHFFLNPRSLL